VVERERGREGREGREVRERGERREGEMGERDKEIIAKRPLSASGPRPF
jgi:hypothetical protein